MSLTTPPDAPSRGDAPATFSAKADAFLAWLVGFVSEMNAEVAKVLSYKNNAENAAASASVSAQTAEAAAASVVVISGVPEWTSGASYDAGDAVYSLADGQTYRALTTHSGITTNPANDPTNWAAISADGPAIQYAARRRALAIAANS